MAERGDIETRSISLVLGSKGVQLDESGRIRFVDPEIVQAIVTAQPSGVEELAGSGNGAQCACNTGACAAPDEVLARVRTLEGRGG